MAWMVQGFQAIRNIIDKDAAVSEGISYISPSLWINKFSIFNEATSMVHSKPIFCICIIPGIFTCVGLVIIISHSWTFFDHFLFYHIFHNRYTFFLYWGYFRFLWVSHIYGWQIGRQNPAWTTCSLIVSIFVIFPHQFLVDHMWMLINKQKSRD